MGAAASNYVYNEATSLSTLIGFSKDPRTALLNARDHYGDIFLVESAFVSTKIAGLCGPEALKEFEAKLQDGSLVKQGAFPPSILALLGPILVTLDGDVHHAKKAALLKALSPAQLDVYKPIIRRIVQTEHSKWAAHGGAISFAVNTKILVFKVLLAVLYGVEGEFDTYRRYVDDYVTAIKQSAKVTDEHGVTCRAKFIAEIIVPAIAAAKANQTKRQQQPLNSVLDVLVATGDLNDDDDLQNEMFHFMFAGFGGVSAAATNLITAVCVFPDIRAKVLRARDDFLLQYDGRDESPWNHLDEMGYLNQFVLEVKRYFVAGPTQVYAKAARDVDLVTSTGVFRIPEGALVMAGLEATNRDPDTWPSPDSFDPARFTQADVDGIHMTRPFAFCPHGFGSHRRCAGEQLTTVIMQSVLVSLFDFTWKMIPGQEYALQPHSVTAVPIGQLMGVNFQRRLKEDDPSTPEVEDYGIVGTHDDWKFLRRPDVQELTGVNAAEYFDDSRLDLWTRLMIQLISKKQTLWNRPYATTALSVPQHQQVLDKITLIQTNIQIPIVDEDWPCQPWLEIQQSNLLRDHAPFVDDFTHSWLPAEDGERYVMSKVCVLLNVMQGLEVRPGFAKYGADAFFNKHGKLVKIQRGDKTYTNTHDDWAYIKMTFRGTLMTKVTAVDHLLGVHVTAANYLVTASREKLPVRHPLRRLLKPFTFRSVSINYGAGRALFWPNGMLQRAFALTTAGMKQTWEFGLTQFKYATFPETMAKQEIDTLTLPFHQDGLDYWHIVYKFVANYVDLYYPSDDDVAMDVDVGKFWRYLGELSPAPLPDLTKSHLKDFLSQGIFLVSSMHNHLGTIAEYVSDPAFCPSAWVEGELSARPGNAVRLALIMSATGFTQPSITEDFSHIMLDDNAKALVKTFTADLYAQIKVVDARNANRVQPFQSFNPKAMEMAVSI
ncbi:hypothetical protein DYB37_012326 [Aphanomyces astaci]|uniref:Lipoxygenase domain-containing protein n=1 Tax=Aphanomyces astaci TaxID=112090 RepID=A0A418CJV8_APHAT|nr:hypothetical protein DYB35_001407 [Aphanomyces astaci]RHZ27651.1 hypothetical protein DYB37_012326 [Aphanomyces astaci]